MLPMRYVQWYAANALPELRPQALRDCDAAAGAGRAVWDARMKFQVMMSVVIEARTPQEAQDHAVKLKELVKNPLARMAIEGDGVRIVGGEPVVYKPQQIA
jgi:hypothetical protein